MSLLNKIKILLLLILYCVSTISDAKPLVCLTGRIEKSLPSYGASFINAAMLARKENGLDKQIEIKSYLYDNRPLEPIRVYNQMKQDGCAAIIGYEYLSDLLLVTKTQNDSKIPIFTSYASTLSTEKLPNNIFIFMPDYNYLTKQMMSYLIKQDDAPQNVLLATEVNRIEMQKYKEAYAGLLSARKIKFDTFDFLENDASLDQKLADYHKHYDYVFLLSGTIAAEKIADHLNDHHTIFIGTENFGSSTNESFYIRLKDKLIKAFFIRNLDFLKENAFLKKFQTEYSNEFNTNPSILSAYTYDAANIIFKAFKQTGHIDTQSILNTNYTGITGTHINNHSFYRSPDTVILAVGEDGYHRAQ